MGRPGCHLFLFTLRHMGKNWLLLYSPLKDILGVLSTAHICGPQASRELPLSGSPPSTRRRSSLGGTIRPAYPIPWLSMSHATALSLWGVMRETRPLTQPDHQDYAYGPPVCAAIQMSHCHTITSNIMLAYLSDLATQVLR